MSKIYQQALIALRVTQLGDAPLDINGQLCSKSGRKQAIMLLEGENNPDPKKYEVFGTFQAGEDVDGFKTIVENDKLCVSDVYEFEVDRTSLAYGVSRDGLGFSFNDTLQVTSSVNTSYIGYSVTSAPAWITATLGTTAGVVNTLNLVVDRNRTDDDDRSGKIVLTQNETKVTRTITVTQKGRLTEGTPTEYPYVNEEKVLDKEATIVQIGEQIWSRELFTELGLQGNYNETHGVRIDEARSGVNKINIGEQRLQAWAEAYAETKKIFPQGIVPTASEYHTVAGMRYNKPGWRIIKNSIYSLYGEKIDDSNRNVFRHHLPMKMDMLEFGGFLAAHNWADTTKSPWTGDLSSLTTVIKGKLDLTQNGYDDVRLSYPDHWEWDTNSNILKGSDKYAFSTGMTGRFQLFRNDNDQGNLNELFAKNYIWPHEQNLPDNDASIDIYDYTTTGRSWGAGYYFEQYSSFGAFGEAIRTVRYKSLPYEIYDNATEIRKIKNGDSIPEGFTVVPKGGLRGAWFGNPNLTRDQLILCEAYAQDRFYNGNSNGGIG